MTDDRIHFTPAVLLVFTLFMVGCASIGSKTIYKRGGPVSFQKIGYVNVSEDSMRKEIYPRTDSLHRESLERNIEKYGYENAKYVSGIDTVYGKDMYSRTATKLCEEGEIDVILVSSLSFLKEIHSVFGIKNDQNWNNEVEAKLYECGGDLMVYALHNTYKGNTYLGKTSPEKVVKDGVEGALSIMFEKLDE